MDRFIIEEWMIYSDMDLATAKHLRDTMHPKPLEIICYHCEQSAEKALKAFWLFIDDNPPRTHDLELLRDKCEAFDKAFEGLFDECERLKVFATQPRYPFELDVTENIMNLAISDSEKVSEFIKAKITFVENESSFEIDF